MLSQRRACKVHIGMQPMTAMTAMNMPLSAYTCVSSYVQPVPAVPSAQAAVQAGGEDAVLAWESCHASDGSAMEAAQKLDLSCLRSQQPLWQLDLMVAHSAVSQYLGAQMTNVLHSSRSCS